jgi:hypothetical protein
MPALTEYTPTIQNVTLTSADTEYSLTLPDNTRAFSFQCRTAFDVRYAFETGKVATPTAPYATVKSGHWYNSMESMGNYTPAGDATTDYDGTIYFAADEAGVIVELISWAEA